MTGIGAPEDLYLQRDGSYALGCTPAITLGCPDCGGTCQGSTSLGAPPAILFNSTPTKDWKCNDWLIWHKALVQAFIDGKFKSGIKYPRAKAIELANQVFIQWWKDVVSWFSSNYSFCGYGSDFLSYFKSVGMTDHISALAATITPVVSTVPKVADATAQVVTNTADAAVKTTNVAKWIIPTVLVLGAGGVTYFVYKNYLKGNKKVKIGPAQLGKVSKGKKTKH